LSAVEKGLPKSKVLTPSFGGDSTALGAGGFESGRGGMEDVARPVEAAFG